MPLTSPFTSQTSQRPRVLIAHGWLGHAIQFRALARRVTEAGFDVTVLSYPTLFAPFELAVDRARRAAEGLAGGPLHLIGFSMGGLVMRALTAEKPPGLASLLLIGTPNAGSPIADLAVRFAPTPALRRLMTTAPGFAGDRGHSRRLHRRHAPRPDGLLVRRSA